MTPQPPSAPGRDRRSALLAGSLAINAGANALALVFDQRGEPYLRRAAARAGRRPIR
ncbi:MAG: hypothetical protein IPI73_10205 [Betaproteobacteria bacterium]|nr:hypothetical protein [Betaproteobacteria bacterium]